MLPIYRFTFIFCCFASAGGCATDNHPANEGHAPMSSIAQPAPQRNDSAPLPVPAATASELTKQPVPPPTATSSASVPPLDPAIAQQASYRIGLEDLLEVQVFGVAELTRVVRVNDQGYITLPLIGSIQAAGLTSEQLAKVIAEKLSENYMQDPDVSIFVKEFASQRITVEGAVAKPGIYPIKGQTTLIQSIAMAEGLSRLANPTNVQLFRALPSGEIKIYTFDLSRIRRGEIADPYTQAKDVIVVQRSASREFLNESLFADIADLIVPWRRFLVP